MIELKESPLEKLRKDLEDIKKIIGEIIVPNPKNLQDNCEKFVHIRQEIQELITNLKELNVPIDPELVRLQELDSLAKNNLKVLYKGLKNSPLLEKTKSYPEEFWWWHIPEIYEKKKKENIKRSLIGFSIFLIVSVVLVLFFTFYKTPEEIFLDKVSTIDKLIFEKNYKEAENKAISLCKEYPGRAEAWIKLGIVQELVEDKNYSESFNRARKLTKSDIEFYLMRASEYFKLHFIDKAEEDIKRILKIDSTNPQALYLLGSIYEDKGKIIEAIEIYRKLESLEDRVDPQLMAMVKVRLSILLQKVTIPK